MPEYKISEFTILENETNFIDKKKEVIYNLKLIEFLLKIRAI